ncbi:hypothetical protein [Fontivita pretiosa]|uniref:hypothetical protein n=1 Tax=Fontivita pretiosa TaxID=2989684 RepID=UPI003D16B5D2
MRTSTVDAEHQRRVKQHVDQWRHNRRFAKTIAAEFRDWQINVIFYTALHVIDAALASLGVTVADHQQRNDQVRNNASFAAIRTQYLDLYRISRITRYDPDPDRWLPQEYLTITDLVEALLKPIENGIGPLISKAIKFEPLSLQE